MSDVPQLDTLFEQLGKQAEAIGLSFNQCFGSNLSLQAGERSACEPGALPAGLDGPGLIISLKIEAGTLLVLIPETLPLPSWYTKPDKSQSARMDTLGMEWSFNALPEDLPCDEYKTSRVRSLWEGANRCKPQTGAEWLPLRGGDGSDGQSLWCLFPVASLATPDSEEEAPPSPDVAEAAPIPIETRPSRYDGQRVVRLLKLPVTVMVRLAEKRIELNKLMELGPGAIVTFDKSCEELLDLYVNDCLFARGEAVKIGEKFGLKLNEIGVKRERICPIVE